MIVDRHEILNGLDQLLPARKAGSSQGLSSQDSEPDLHLVQPRGRGWREMKGHIGVLCQPGLVLLVGRQVVQDHMDLLGRGIVCHDLVHEELKVFPLLGLGCLSPDGPRGHLKGGKEMDRPVTLVGALHSSDDLPARGLDVSHLAFDRLDRRLFVHREDQSVPGRVQIQTDNVGRLLRKLRIGAHAPGTSPGELNAFLAQDSPNDVVGDPKSLGQRPSVPSGHPFGRRLLQLGQDSIAKIRPIHRRLSRAFQVPKSLDALFGKALPPHPYGIGADLQFSGHLVVPLSFKAQENDFCALNKPGFFASASGQLKQRRSFLGGTGQGWCNSSHSILLG